ncbi:MAG: Ni/Fe hydrogenase subunit alpha [Planctomycetota bacterium]|nr:MAG: Ni/Fe hydrogenase subunit alpha [Planctomycetota bacterium]
MSSSRTIKVEALTRVEGEGGLYVRLEGNHIEDVKLSIYEPPRFFEAFLRGRPLEEVPDITARICGICPIAYQMSSVHALEAALGVTISPEIRRLRRLLYCGEWIESHALHMHLLHAPDFFGVDSGIDLAERFPEEVTRGLRLKKHGNELLEVLGGRAIHPINIAVGGFYKAPRKDDLLKLLPDFEWGLQAAIATTRWVATLDFPDFTRDYDMVALQHPDEYAMNEGHVASTRGGTVAVINNEQAYEEFHVEHSTALHSRRAEDHASYHVGPLARINLNREQLFPAARKLADEVGIDWPCRNPFQAIVARGLEVVHAYEEAISIIRDYKPFAPARIPYDYQASSGCAATEAPRGLIYHRYEIDGAGRITFAKIVPPTSQNQQQIEADLRDWLPRVLNGDDDQTAMECERLVRCYDPCISCSTHFLKLTVDRQEST